ncbi:30S ribosomal protein S2, partial [Francisella tularensis subsp. holarctica]|nr:30S ribosomal protein S2 [Francisella tularensis subsp. holarctica]
RKKFADAFIDAQGQDRSVEAKAEEAAQA